MTHTIALRSFAIVFLSLLVCAQAIAQQRPQPQVFTSGEWGFRAVFPGTPERSESTTSRGHKSVEFVVESPDKSAYLVMVTEFSRPLDERVLGGARSGVLKGRKLLAEERITVSGFPGWEMQLQDGEHKLLVRVMVAGTRLYQAIFAAEKINDSAMDFVRSLVPLPQ